MSRAAQPSTSPETQALAWTITTTANSASPPQQAVLASVPEIITTSTTTAPFNTSTPRTCRCLSATRGSISIVAGSMVTCLLPRTGTSQTGEGPRQHEQHLAVDAGFLHRGQ